MSRLSKMFHALSGRPDPAVSSEVIGLELSVVKKEGNAAAFLPEGVNIGPLEDGYYEVTVQATGGNEAYPQNDNMMTTLYARFLPTDSKAEAAIQSWGFQSSRVVAIPAGEYFKAFSVKENDDGKLMLSAAMQKRFGRPIRNGVTSMGHSVPKAPPAPGM